MHSVKYHSKQTCATCDLGSAPFFDPKGLGRILVVLCSLDGQKNFHYHSCIEWQHLHELDEAEKEKLKTMKALRVPNGRECTS